MSHIIFYICDIFIGQICITEMLIYLNYIIQYIYVIMIIMSRHTYVDCTYKLQLVCPIYVDYLKYNII